MENEEEILKQVEDVISKKEFSEYLHNKYNKEKDFYEINGIKMVKIEYIPKGFVKELPYNLYKKVEQANRLRHELWYLQSYRDTKIIRKRKVDITNIRDKILRGRDLVGFERTLYENELENYIKEIEFLHLKGFIDWEKIKEKEFFIKEDFFKEKLFIAYIDNLEITLSVTNRKITKISKEHIFGLIMFKTKNKKELNPPSYTLKNSSLLNIINEIK